MQNAGPDEMWKEPGLAAGDCCYSSNQAAFDIWAWRVSSFPLVRYGLTPQQPIHVGGCRWCRREARRDMHTSQMTEHAARLSKLSSSKPDLSCTRCVVPLPSPPAPSGDGVQLQIPLFFHISWWLVLVLAFLHPVTSVLCFPLPCGLSSVVIRGKWKLFYKTSIKFPNPGWAWCNITTLKFCINYKQGLTQGNCSINNMNTKISAIIRVVRSITCSPVRVLKSSSTKYKTDSYNTIFQWVKILYHLPLHQTPHDHCWHHCHAVSQLLTALSLKTCFSPSLPLLKTPDECKWNLQNWLHNSCKLSWALT